MSFGGGGGFGDGLKLTAKRRRAATKKGRRGEDFEGGELSTRPDGNCTQLD